MSGINQDRQDVRYGFPSEEANTSAISEQSGSEVHEINEENATLEKFQSFLDIEPSLPVIRSPSPSILEKSQIETIKTPAQGASLEPWKKSEVNVPWSANQSILAQLIGTRPHFIPQKLNEEIKTEVMEISDASASKKRDDDSPAISISEENHEEIQEVQTERENKSSKDTIVSSEAKDKISNNMGGISNRYPNTLSWLNEFKRT